MRTILLVCLAASTSLMAQVRFSRDQISVTVDGKPFTTFHYGGDSGKPFLAPLRSASGKVVSRLFREHLEDEQRFLAQAESAAGPGGGMTSARTVQTGRSRRPTPARPMSGRARWIALAVATAFIFSSAHAAGPGYGHCFGHVAWAALYVLRL